MKKTIHSAILLLCFSGCVHSRVYLPPPESADPERVRAVGAYLDETIIPAFCVKAAPIGDAMCALAELAKQHAPSGRGMSFILKLPAEATVTLDLTDVTARQAITAICRQAQCQWTLSPKVLITPRHLSEPTPGDPWAPQENF